MTASSPDAVDLDAMVAGFELLYRDSTLAAALVDIRPEGATFVAGNTAAEQLFGTVSIAGRSPESFQDDDDLLNPQLLRTELLAGRLDLVGTTRLYRRGDGTRIEVDVFGVTLQRRADRVIILVRFALRGRMEWLRDQFSAHDRLLAALSEIRGALLRGAPEDEVLDAVCRQSTSLLAADHAGILSLADAETVSITVVDRGSDDPALGRSFRVDDTEFAEAVRSRRTLQYEVPTEILRGLPERLPEVDPDRPMYVAVAPVIVTGHVVGVLAVRRRSGAYADAELELLDTFAREVSDAVGLTELRADQGRLRVLEAREEIARNLHDEVTQDLIAVRFGLLHVVRRVADSALRTELEGCLADLDDATRRLRDVVAGLDTRASADDFVDVVRSVTGSKATRRDVDWTVSVEGPVGRLHGEERAEVLRVVNEGVSNVVRHAAATRLRVSLVVDASWARVRVEDDGIGLATRTAAGSGLANLVARAEARGGWCRLGASPEGGTAVEWAMPLGWVGGRPQE